MEKPEEPSADIDAFIEARVDSVSITNLGFIVFLKGDDPDRVLPIFIGANEAQSIALALNRQPPPRPMTHDLLKTMLESLDAAVVRAEITEIKDNTFFGRVFVKKAGVEDMDFDARPSDSLALALRWSAPIFVHRRVFAEAAVPVAKQKEGEAKMETHESTAPAPVTPAEKLRVALKKAVQEEHYEEAARLRDELKRMQAGN